MSYQIIGESIKSATSLKLGDIFKVATTQVDNQGNIVYTYPYRYKENITNQRFPNFHIIQVNSNVTQRQRKVESIFNNDLRRIQLDYLMNIQYRVAENTETVTNLRQQLDAVGLKLMTEFTELDLAKPTEIKNARYEIVDGVLQFFYNITVFATMETPNDEEMENIDIEENIKEEE